MCERLSVTQELHVALVGQKCQNPTEYPILKSNWNFSWRTSVLSYSRILPPPFCGLVMEDCAGDWSVETNCCVPCGYRLVFPVFFFFLQNIMAGAAVYFPSAFDCTVVPPRNMTSPYASCGLT